MELNVGTFVFSQWRDYIVAASTSPNTIFDVAVMFNSIVCVLCRRALTNIFNQNKVITVRSHSW